MERVSFIDLSAKKESHGMSRHPMYFVWRSMRRRCDSPNSKYYNDYGGRGISVCDSWNRSFINFYNDMGDTYLDGLEIDRIDNNGGYNKDNCRWATRSTNIANRRKYKGKYKMGTRPSCSGGKFQSTIHIEGVNYFLGTFSTEDLAHIEYSKMRNEWYGIG